MSVFRFFHALFLRLSGFGLICVGAVGLLLPSFAEHEGVALIGGLPFEVNVGAALLGLFLMLPWWLPHGLRRPDRSMHAIWAAPLAGASWLASTILISALRTVDPVFATGLPLGPELDLVWVVGALVSLALVTTLAIKGKPSENFEHAAPTPMTESGISLSIHRAVLSFAGIAVAMSAVITGRILLESPPITFPGISTGPLNAQIGFTVVGVIAGLLLLSGRTTPRAVRRPTRWFHFFAVGSWLFLLMLPVLAVFLTVGAAVAFTARDIGFPDETAFPLARSVTATLFGSVSSAAGSSMAITLGVIASLALIVTTVVVIRRPVQISQDDQALLPYSSATTSQETPDVPKKKDIRVGALPEPKLPAMGGIMKLYVAADWLVLRLLGLGLLGTGYLLWQMIEAGRELPQIAMSYGFAPFHALIAYGVAGAFLAVPYLLPRMIVAPRHVIGGLVKACLILGAGLVVRPIVPTWIKMVPDEQYHATLLYLAPFALNAVVGLAVAGALFTSFFRMMGKEPKTDYLGNPMIEMTPADLHRLREARMGIN